MKLRSPYSIMSLAASLALATSLPAATMVLSSEPKEEKPEAIRWPATPRPALNIEEYYSEFDGHRIEVLNMKAIDLNIELVNRPNFFIEQAKSPRYSAIVYDDALPELSIGISVFSKTEFLQDLSDENWNAYLASITLDNPQTKIVFENSNRDQKTTPYVLGQTFRQVAYENDKGNGKIDKKREIFAFVKDTLLVISASGSKDAVDANWFRFEHLIGELSRVQTH